MKRIDEQRLFEKFQNETGVSNEDYYAAFKRVKRIKRFYTHLIVYILVNTYLIVNHCFEANSMQSLFQLHTYSTAFFWGIGLVAHGLSVFGHDIFFGSNWEEKKIKELMDKEKKNRFE